MLAGASAQVASSEALDEVLATSHQDLLRETAPMIGGAVLACAASLLVFDGHPAARLICAITAVVCVVAMLLTVLVTRTRKAGERTLLFVHLINSVGLLGMTLYFGIASPAAVASGQHVYTASLHYPRIGLVVILVEGLGRAAIFGLVVGGVLVDPGVLTASELSPGQQLMAEMLIQVSLVLSFMLGRVAYKKTTARFGAQLKQARATAERELAIAQHIQRALLPAAQSLPAFDVSTVMHAAAEVGGDYFDVRPAADGCWVAIGDVSGHGLSSGLVMMMVQTTVASLTIDDTYPVEHVVDRVNRVVFDNVRRRLKATDYVTFALARLHADGTFALAGRHEPTLVWRAATKKCERLDPDGIWLGIKPSIVASTQTVTGKLAPGDLLVFHTDGLTEARGATGRYGLDRLQAAVERLAGTSASDLRKAIEQDVTAFSSRFDDDAALVVVRYTGAPA
ncbi:MAG: SpoIIE family protein phosphatase [Kofleriaceae bacterium]|nr:SpoIIE family protein phosphatase [Kofleriaceae bacterium]